MQTVVLSCFCSSAIVVLSFKINENRWKSMFYRGLSSKIDENPVRAKKIRFLASNFGINFRRPFVLVFFKFLMDFDSHFGCILASFSIHFACLFLASILHRFSIDFESFLDRKTVQNRCQNVSWKASKFIIVLTSFPRLPKIDLFVNMASTWPQLAS